MTVVLTGPELRRPSAPRRHRLELSAIAAASVVSVVTLLLLVQPFDPDSACCDHLFYRAQAVEWLGLNVPGALEVPPRSGLADAYTNFFYEPVNGLAGQPPHIYRIFTPFITGVVGLVLPINAAFYWVNAVSLLVLSAASAWAVFHVTRLLIPALATSVLAVWLPSLGPPFAKNYMLVDSTAIALIAVVVLLVVKRQWLPALLISVVIAPLTRENLVTLALFVALAAHFFGVRKWWYWPLAALPALIVLMVRLAIPVVAPAPTSILFTYEDPYQSVQGLFIAFGAVIPLLLGIFHRSVRSWFVASLPVLLLLLILNTSVVAREPRLWLTYWPFLLIFGMAGLMATRVLAVRGTWLLLLAVSLGVGIVAADGWVPQWWIAGPAVASIVFASSLTVAENMRSVPQKERDLV